MSVSCECGMFSDRSFCVGAITRPEGSYRLWYECDREALKMGDAGPIRAVVSRKKI
jgi:hypothetical protein